MSELRQNLATKEWVIIATERAKRPDEFIDTNRSMDSNAPAWDDMPILSGKRRKGPGSAADAETDNWQVRIVGNRFPALAVGAPGTPISGVGAADFRRGLP